MFSSDEILHYQTCLVQASEEVPSDRALSHSKSPLTAYVQCHSCFAVHNGIARSVTSLACKVKHNMSFLQAQAQFEAWHAEKWLSPRRVLHKAGADMRPVLLPFWFFEAAIKVDYSAQVFVPTAQPQVCKHANTPRSVCAFGSHVSI